MEATYLVNALIAAADAQADKRRDLLGAQDVVTGFGEYSENTADFERVIAISSAVILLVVS